MEYSDLPKNYWDVIEQHYPNYSSCDCILHSDIMQRIVDGELTPEHDEDNDNEDDDEGAED